MIDSHALARILLSRPRAVVTTWDSSLSEDVVVEQVLFVRGHKEAVVVLGMEMPVALLATGEVAVGETPGIVRAVARHQAEQERGWQELQAEQAKESA